MRRVLALLLCTMLLTSTAGFAAPSQKAEESTLLFSQSFNTVITNTQPIDMRVVGRGTRVLDYGTNNKALAFDAGSSVQLAEASVSLENKFFISFDIAATDKIGGSVNLKTSSGSGFSIVKFTDGKICTHNNRAVAGVNERFTNVTIEANAATSSYNLYINGKCVKSNYYVSNLTVKNAAAVSFEFNSENGAKVYLDNVNMGQGKAMKSYPVAQYDPTSAEYDDSTYGVTDDIYLNIDFEEGKRTSAAFQHKNNTLERYTDEDGSGYCKFERLVDADFHLDVNTSAYQSDSLVYQYDFRLMSSETRFQTQIKSTSNQYFNMFTLADGVLQVGNFKKVIPVGEWQTMSVVYNVLEGTYDAYLNYSLIADDLPVNYLYLHQEAMTWRIHVNRSSGGVDHFHVDNMVVYGGDAPRKDLEYVEQTEVVIDPLLSALPGEHRQKSALVGRVSYHPTSGVLYANDTKTIYEPAIINDTVMVPVELFKTAFGLETSFDAVSGTAKIGNLSLSVGSTAVDGGVYNASLAVAPTVRNDTLMVPLKNIVENGLGKKFYQNTTVAQTPGMIVIGDSEFTPPNGSELQELNDFALYLRPDADFITNDYNASYLKGVHPRYLADKADFDRIRSISKTDPTMIEWSKFVLNQADRYVRDAEPLVYELRDGVRLWYVSMDMVEQMSVLGMAYQLTGDKKYVDRAWLDLESVCTFPDWHPEHHIDVGGLAVGVSIGYDWMYDAFTDEQRAIIEKGVYQNAYIDYVDGYQGKSQYMKSGVVNSANHNMVMNAGATAIGIAFMDIYPKESAYFISEALKCLEVAIPSYAPEGAWYEGMNYAKMTLEYMNYQLGALDQVFGTNYTLDKTQGIDKIVDYFLYIQSNLGAFAYADVSNPNVSVDPGILWLAEHFDDYASVATYHSSLGIPPSPKAMLYYHPEKMNASADMDLDHLYQSLNVVTMRDTWDGDAQTAFAGMKGGRPADTHGHMDSGMFTFYANGTRWTADLSSENYNVAKYWENSGPESARWSYFRLRAEGHSTIFINPAKEGEYDPQATAKVVRYESEPRGTIAVLDMTDLHMGKATKAERAMYFADDRRSLVLRDELTLPAQSDVYWHMITPMIVEVNPDGKSVKVMDNANPNNYITLEFLCNQDFTVSAAPTAPLPTSPTPAGMGDNSDKTTIRLVSKAYGDLNITVKITPCTVEDGASVQSFDMPIASWSIADGAIPARPELDRLSVNGIEYSPSKKIITYNVSANEANIPDVVAESATCNVSIQKAVSFDDPTVITVSDKVNPGTFTTYMVYFNKIKALPVEGLTERNIVKIDASDEPQPENPVVASYDRDLSTRWSAEGSQNLILDLGHVTDFDKVVMAFMSGDSRHYNLKMFVSADGIEYTEVFSGTSGGKTNDYEVFDIGLQNARFVRIEGNGYTGVDGKSKGLWNSWTEVAVAKVN